MKFIFKLMSGLLLFLFSLSILFADTVYLKNGKKLEGKIINQSRTKIQIKINGKIQTIDKKNISKIKFQDLEALKRKQEEERKRQEELKRKQEEERKRQEELKRKQEEERKRQEELKRKQEEERKRQEELKRKQEEERKRQEELKRKQEEERKRQEELKRKQEKEQKKELQKISPEDIKFVYLRSALLPGWGHYKIGSKYQPYIWGGLFWTSLIATLAQANKARLLQKEYDNTTSNQFILNQSGLIPQEFSLYFINESNSKKALTKKAINQTAQLGVLTFLIYSIQFYFLYDEIKDISLYQNNKKNQIYQLANQTLFINNYQESINLNTALDIYKNIQVDSYIKEPILISFEGQF